LPDTEPRATGSPGAAPLQHRRSEDASIPLSPRGFKSEVLRCIAAVFHFWRISSTASAAAEAPPELRRRNSHFALYPLIWIAFNNRDPISFNLPPGLDRDY
jgi:hypothetical protein